MSDSTMSDSTPENDTPKSVPTQVDDIVTNLYRRTCKCGDSDRWSKFRDANTEDDDLKLAITDDPIIHRHVNHRGKWITASFTIQSPPMRAHIRTALEKYQDFDPDLEEWTFRLPYNPLVHRWDRLVDLLNADDQDPDSDTTQAIQQLVAFLRPILSNSIKALTLTKDTGKVVFEDIWQIFPPNELVITTIFGVEAICRVTRYERLQMADNKPYWKVDLEYVDWNGERCGYQSTNVNIVYFSGKKHVNSLPVYPLSFNSSAEEMKERITNRGRLFEKLRGYHFQNCKGTKILLEGCDERSVSGRVIIDTYAYYHSMNRNKPGLRPLENASEPEEPNPTHGDDSDGNEHESDTARRNRSRHINYDDDYSDDDDDEVSFERSNKISRSPMPFVHNQPRVVEYRPGVPGLPPLPRQHGSMGYRPPQPYSRHMPPPPNVRPRSRSRTRSPPPIFQSPTADGPAMSIGKSTTKPLERCEVLDPLTDIQCLLATPWVIGLDLKKKDWARFCVDSLSPVVWNDEAFEKLILPGNEKDLAWAFVENKALSGNSFDDFVEDKGRGLIILMFGPPGVGKTYTAEAVAERARVPLYNVSAAALGTNPADVQDALDEALDLCKLWNAMLLLDEADVFLGARSNADLARNELVAVFLTRLEYYQGICFMTTNRMASLDHAIQSRVDLFLRYANLTVSARRLVWENFLVKAGRDNFSVSEVELDNLAEYELNGREIKNLVKTAHLLSVKNPDEKISMGRLTMLVNNRLQALAALELQKN